MRTISESTISRWTSSIQIRSVACCSGWCMISCLYPPSPQGCPLDFFRLMQYKSGGGRYVHCPCEDRHPPRLESIVKFCEEAAEWLSRSHEHVVVGHCRSSLGCSAEATMMACLLLRTKQRSSVLDALQAVADVRMQDSDVYKMVTPSQRQYV